jgi:hypothetical protein
VVKTTVVLPKELWRAVKIRAVEEDGNLNRVVIEALEAHLRVKRERKS